MTTSITTFLTYDTQAEEAAKLYTSLFDGKIKETMRYPAGGPKPEGSVLSVTFELFGQTMSKIGRSGIIEQSSRV